MLNNTTTAIPNILTSGQLREALDRWCEEQPGVITKKISGVGGFAWRANIFIPDQGKDNVAQNISSLIATGGDKIKTFLINGAIDRLTFLAIEHQYTPWLQLAANLPYTGANASRLALRAFDNGLAETEPVEDPPSKPLTDDGAMGWD